jgi:hypothetical protein
VIVRRKFGAQSLMRDVRRAETLCSKPGLNVVQVCSESSCLEPKAVKTPSHDEITLKNDTSDVLVPRGKNPAALEAGKRLSDPRSKTGCP